MNIKQQALTEELKKQVYKGFSRHAIAMTGHDEKFDPIAFIAEEEGRFAGAVVAELFWGALHIKYVYVEESYRHQNLGTRLISQVLDFGRQHKCLFAFVETMSFQALEFYEKCGFQLEFTRTGYSHGTSFHYLRKDL